MERRFVDCHTHMVPSGDDGVGSVEEGLELTREAARRGTATMFATPHVWPHMPLTADREQQVRAAHSALRPDAGLDLRLGFELTPTRALLREDPARYALDGVPFVLVEVPFVGPADLLFELGEHIERSGLRPVVAHPERTESVLAHPALTGELAARGWPLQVNATSLLGYHGPEPERLAWALIEEGRASIVASDGHRRTRPPFLDGIFAAVIERVGEPALSLFDGSALGLAGPSRRPESSRAASPAA